MTEQEKQEKKEATARKKAEAKAQKAEEKSKKAEEKTKKAEEKSKKAEEKAQKAKENAKKAEENAKKAEKKAKKAEEKAKKAEEKKLKQETKKELKKEEKQAAENQTNWKKNLGTILLVVLAVAAIVGVLVLKFAPQKSPGETGTTPADRPITSELSSVVLSKKITKIPLMPTDIPTISYTADAAGNIVYYEWNGKEYAEIQPTGKMDFTLTLSGQKIAVHIPYVERDGVLTGFGLFTADQNQENVYIYNFIMFKVQNLPDAFKKDGHCLLLMHTDKTKAYTLDPVWEQGFILNRSNGAMQDFLNDRSQMVSADGGIRRAQYKITECALNTASANILFCSSRDNEPDANGVRRTDIYKKDGRKDVLVLKDVLDDYVKPLPKDSFAFMRKTADGFYTALFKDGQEQKLYTFKSNLGAGYLHNGDYILDKQDGKVYTTYNTNSIETKGYRINPQVFAVSPKEKYVAMAGTSANAFDYYIYIYNADTKNFAAFKDENYAPHSNLRFIDENTVTYYAMKLDGYENVVVDVSRIK